MAYYPGGSILSPEWQAVRAFIRARAGDRCEQCGVRHLTYGVRMDGEFTDLGLDKPDAQIEYDYAIGIAGLMSGRNDVASLLPPMIRIVCTVAHFDGGLSDHSASNLRFWCQQCHNRHDAKDRARGIKARRDSAQGILI
jgi:hypothetical protein